ncbi:hypothetical protein CHELA20_50196 [Hyphomicrobiales bacterium]|nr:hypothetical protein CHELA41_20175 [Hyphomicrobiales bacterium]CAH1667357.1 hypothetical protein CHELA20_50196 [Hyphomicrobiales bacterium]
MEPRHEDMALTLSLSQMGEGTLSMKRV